ncbi:MAG: methyltransferase domain-containing protein [Saprospiraceae bacterium]
MELSPDYWNKRYLEGNTPWDIGQVSPPIKSFIDKLSDKQLRILIPGAGKGYEAIYLHQQGFTNVFVCDWAEEAFQTLKTKAPDFPLQQLIVGDFFKLTGYFDLILEQTFFCAISPVLRTAYVQQCCRLLSSGGQVAGLLFGTTFPTPGPPFGGTVAEYERLFQPYFHIITLEVCQNSIPPRLGNELFFHLALENRQEKQNKIPQ